MASSKQDLAHVAGPDSMAKPGQASSSSAIQPTQSAPAEPAQPKKKKHRAGRRKAKNKRDNFPRAPEMGPEEALDVSGRQSMVQPGPFYRLQQRSHSNSSLDSEALLDHRGQLRQRPRRESLQQTGFTRPSLPFARQRGSAMAGALANTPRPRTQTSETAISEDEDEETATDHTPLLSRSRNHSRPELARLNSGHHTHSYGTPQRGRRSSAASHASSRKRIQATTHIPPMAEDDEYDVNNPPSVPTSPQLGSFDDPMLHLNNEIPSSHSERGRDVIIDIDGGDRRYSDTPSDGHKGRRPTVADLAERDVCFPGDSGLSEIAEEDRQSNAGSARLARKRTRGRQWPDLEVLEEWAREEKEERTQQEHVRAMKVNEPVLVEGRLRPTKVAWHREEDEPFRFTYFNEMIGGTIHARTISDLAQDGTAFEQLFRPDPIELDSESEEEDNNDNVLERPAFHQHTSIASRLTADPTPTVVTAAPSEAGDMRSPGGSKPPTRSSTPSVMPSANLSPRRGEKRKRYGPRPTFWLDVLQPTEMEMKTLAKAFGIHQLTTEDILMQEQREKVELFASYYFMNYRSFEQDKESEDYMDPVNFYAVVFADGIITFHHSQTPHPANVRRRIRQLNDYMSPTADWISYALIDDITDVYAPRVSQIEEEVDDIDEEILYLHVTSADDAEGLNKKKEPEVKPSKGIFDRWPFKSGTQGDHGPDGDKPRSSGGDMLRRVGECRKKVMSLYRLLGNKADVIKGFAKRCNENWEVAPRSEIGLYLGDIQDHIVTMNNNLSHYENLLSRAHSNYVAQINIRMNERAESNADILGKLTVIGTIVLPMNIITGMWGMNVYVPGQVEYKEDLTWFFGITAFLLSFGVGCYYVAKKMYGIV